MTTVPSQSCWVGASVLWHQLQFKVSIFFTMLLPFPVTRHPLLPCSPSYQSLSWGKIIMSFNSHISNAQYASLLREFAFCIPRVKVGVMWHLNPVLAFFTSKLALQLLHFPCERGFTFLTCLPFPRQGLNSK